MSQKRDADEAEPKNSYQKKKKVLAGADPEIDVDLRELSPDQLDSSITNITPKERRVAEAFSFWPVPREEFLTPQADYIEALMPRKTALVRYRSANFGDKPPWVRSRKVVTFFIRLLSRKEINENKDLEDAVFYRLAYWITYIFENAGRFKQECETLIGTQDAIKFYTSVVAGAVRHVEWIQRSVAQPRRRRAAVRRCR